MSGVGITGEIKPLNGGSFPVFADIDGEGGFRAVVDSTARDAIPANYRKIGMVITDQTTGLDWQLVGGIANANWKRYTGAPFKGTYYVDPAFSGTQTGSASNPFLTYAAVFAFALTAGVTSGIIYQAPGSTVVENVTFPLTGDWEIATQPGQGAAVTVITGNIDISSSASARRSLTNIRITGNLTGNCSAGTQRILFAGTNVSGTTTFTVSGAGIQRVASRSGTSAAIAGGNVQACIFTGAFSVAGTFWGSDAIFATSLAVTAVSEFSHCALPPTTTTSSAGLVDLILIDCTSSAGGALAFTAASGSLRLRPDFATLSELQRFGTTSTGAVSIQGLIGAASRSAQPSNVGVTALSGILPAGLMVIEACLTLLANGGLTAGLAVLNVTYTDMTGTLVTESVTTALNVANAVGTKARGALQFSQNGATAVSFSVTGITVATALSYQVDVAVRQAS